MDASSSTEDLKKCTAVELRAIIALGHRAQSALDARSAKVAYPSRLPPSLVIAFLPLHELAPALRVSTAWRNQAEEVFRAIATRLGLARSTSWRDVVRESAKLRWLRVAFCGVFFNSLVFPLKSLITPCIMEGARNENIDTTTYNDTTFFGRAVEIQDQETLRWELRMQRANPTEIIDTCGVAILDGEKIMDQHALNPNDVLHYYFWHSDGCDWTPSIPTRHRFTAFSDTDETALERDDEGNVWGDDATLQIIATLPASGNLLRLERCVLSDGRWVRRDQRRTSTLQFPSRILVAPIVCLYRTSCAELLRFSRETKPRKPRLTYRI